MKSLSLRKYLFIVLVAGIIISFFTTCKKPVREVSILTFDAVDIDISYTTATLKGEITDLGSLQIQEYGIILSNSVTFQSPVNQKYNAQPTKGQFNITFTGLEKNNTYYFKGYVIIAGKAMYSSDPKNFKTKDTKVASISSLWLTDTTLTTARASALIISDGGEPVTNRGFCWGASPNPTLASCLDTTLNGSGTGTFTGQIHGLASGTQYYVRAYTINLKGTSYNSSDITFTTYNIPSLSTTALSSQTIFGTNTGGNVTNSGGATVTSRGVCWGTTTAPTIALTTKTSDGSGSGTFVSSITGLTPGTQYYIRAYATNRFGTNYGNEILYTPPVPAAAVTTAATLVGNTTVTLNGTVNANSFSATVTFEYGTTTAYGTSVSATPGTVTGNTNTNVSANLTGLTPGTLYHYKVKAVNIGGTTDGGDQSFTTSQGPDATTNDATSVTSNSATLNGDVNANNSSTAVSFEYGTTTAYGSTVAAIPGTATGNSLTTVSAGLSGLVQGTAYHYRIKAISSAGTNFGLDKVLITQASPTASTLSATAVTTTTATLNGSVNSNNLSTTLTFEYGLTTSYGSTITAIQSPLTGNTLTSITANLTGLTPGTLYHFRINATSLAGTTYGSDLSFTTNLPAGLPVVTTTSVSSIGTTTATSGGNVTSDGGNTINARGVCWSINANPSITDLKTSETPGTGTFSSSIIGLTAVTSYHVRAYATNSAGTTYGSDVPFTTLGPPTVSTVAISSTGTLTAKSGGNVTLDGGVAVTAKGVCWSLTSNPTIADAQTIDGSGVGSFISSLSGLSPNMTYYVRAYATNSIGTNYGTQVNFTTLSQVTDIDGNVYNSVTIGTQIWMQENLRTLHYRNGTLLSNDNNIWSGNGVYTGQACWYNNDIANKFAYGALYNYYAVVDNQILCPTGWHAPTDAEWTTLVSYLGGGSVAGGKLKETGIILWNSPNTGASNETGFTALPAGNRTGNTFYAIGSNTTYWSTSLNGTSEGYTRQIRYNETTVGRYSYGYYSGLSVRCLQGEGVVLPAVTTSPIINIFATSATSGGNVTSTGGGSLIERGVCWSTSHKPDVTGNHTSDGTITGNFVSNITGLTVGITYYVRAFATNSVGTVYGDEVSFQTVYAVGDNYQGGYIFNITGTYPNQHGLICAPADQSTGSDWGCFGTLISGADGTIVGTGLQNSLDIINGCATAGIASRICRNLNLNGYSDWYLPSKDELGLMYDNLRLNGIGGFANSYYWSSTEWNDQPNLAWMENFTNGSKDAANKNISYRVRAIRTF